MGGFFPDGYRRSILSVEGKVSDARITNHYRMLLFSFLTLLPEELHLMKLAARYPTATSVCLFKILKILNAPLRLFYVHTKTMAVATLSRTAIQQRLLQTEETASDKGITVYHKHQIYLKLSDNQTAKNDENTPDLPHDSEKSLRQKSRNVGGCPLMSIHQGKILQM